MKKTLRSFVICCICIITFLNLSAQSTFDFEYFSEEYIEFENGIFLTDSVFTDSFDVWWGNEWILPLDFTFNFAGVDYDTLVVSGGYFLFDINSDETYIFNFDGPSLISASYWTNPIREELSPVTYKYEGPVGQRILKVQHENVAFFDGVEEDVINFQTWFYEGSNAIEYRYGPSNIVSDNIYSNPDGFTLGPMVGLVDQIWSSDEPLIILVAGDAAAPVATTNPYEFPEGLIGTPPENMVYQFSPSTVSVSESVIQNEILMLPNPTEGHINISIEKPNQVDHIKILDSKGALVSQLNEVDEVNYFELNASSGIFFAHIVDNNGHTKTKKIIVK